MTLQSEPIARAGMLIRKPVAVVFDAFIDPGDYKQILVHEK